MSDKSWICEIQAPPEMHESIEQFFNALCWKIRYADGFIPGYKHGLDKQWIPCSKELPPCAGNYLVCGKNKQVSVLRFFVNSESKEYWEKVIDAWMPLPSPYIKEK